MPAALMYPGAQGRGQDRRGETGPAQSSLPPRLRRPQPTSHYSQSEGLQWTRHWRGARSACMRRSCGGTRTHRLTEGDRWAGGPGEETGGGHWGGGGEERGDGVEVEQRGQPRRRQCNGRLLPIHRRLMQGGYAGQAGCARRGQSLDELGAGCCQARGCCRACLLASGWPRGPPRRACFGSPAQD